MTSLYGDGAGGRAEARVNARDGFQKNAVGSHGVVHARRGHHERREAAQHADDDDRGKNNSARGTEQDFAGLRDEGAVGRNFFDGHQINEDSADDDVHGGDRNHAERQRAGKRAARIAHFAGNFCGVPPAAEGKRTRRPWRRRERARAAARRNAARRKERNSTMSPGEKRAPKR